MRFSANLGYLWTDRPLPEAVYAAHAAGFAAVELHWPYDTDPAALRAALNETGLPLLSLNAGRGARAGDFGLTAVPGREAEARAAIAQALDYAHATGAGAVHLLAGRAEGAEARASFIANLRHACTRAAAQRTRLLIEPKNRHDAPGYFLRHTDQAVEILDEVAAPETLGLMFDCYHVAREEGDVTHRLQTLLPRIAHIQFAGVPERGPPDRGELDYGHVFAALRDLGYAGHLGAEYRPDGAAQDSFGWMRPRAAGGLV